MSLETELMTLASGNHAKFSAMMAAVMEIAQRPSTESVSLGSLWVFHSRRKRGRVKAEDADDAQEMFDEWLRVHPITEKELSDEIKRSKRDCTESLGEFRYRWFREKGILGHGAATNRARGQQSSAELVRKKTRTVQADLPRQAETSAFAGEATDTLFDRF